jgi:2-polyprenyl-6-methoxyphenol hydroxylase-like FAD-dependent oxidoreductase
VGTCFSIFFFYFFGFKNCGLLRQVKTQGVFLSRHREATKGGSQSLADLKLPEALQPLSISRRRLLGLFREAFVQSTFAPVKLGSSAVRTSSGELIVQGRRKSKEKRPQALLFNCHNSAPSSAVAAGIQMWTAVLPYPSQGHQTLLKTWAKGRLLQLAPVSASHISLSAWLPAPDPGKARLSRRPLAQLLDELSPFFADDLLAPLRAADPKLPCDIRYPVRWKPAASPVDGQVSAGGAAVSISTLSGVGLGSLAIEDGFSLGRTVAQCINAGGNVLEALKTWERERIPRWNYLAKASATQDHSLLLTGMARVALRDTTLKFGASSNRGLLAQYKRNSSEANQPLFNLLQ